MKKIKVKKTLQSTNLSKTKLEMNSLNLTKII